jgi:zinc protease
VGGFGGRAASLNHYYFATGDPGYFPKDIGRYRKVKPEEVRDVAARWLKKDARVVLTVIPKKVAGGEPAQAPARSARPGKKEVR